MRTGIASSFERAIGQNGPLARLAWVMARVTENMTSDLLLLYSNGR